MAVRVERVAAAAVIAATAGSWTRSCLGLTPAQNAPAGGWPYPATDASILEFEARGCAGSAW